MTPGPDRLRWRSADTVAPEIARRRTCGPPRHANSNITFTTRFLNRVAPHALRGQNERGCPFSACDPYRTAGVTSFTIDCLRRSLHFYEARSRSSAQIVSMCRITAMCASQALYRCAPQPKCATDNYADCQPKTPRNHPGMREEKNAFLGAR